MSTTTPSLSSYQLEKLHRHNRSRSDSSVQHTWSVTSRAKQGYGNTRTDRMSLLSESRLGGGNGAIKMDPTENHVPQVETPKPSRWSFIGWSRIITTILMILPFIKSKGVKSTFDTAIGTVVDVIRVIATKAEEMLDAAVRKLPGGLYIRKAEEPIKGQVHGTNAKAKQDKENKTE